MGRTLNVTVTVGGLIGMGPALCYSWGGVLQLQGELGVGFIVGGLSQGGGPGRQVLVGPV